MIYLTWGLGLFGGLLCILITTFIVYRLKAKRGSLVIAKYKIAPLPIDYQEVYFNTDDDRKSVILQSCLYTGPRDVFLPGTTIPLCESEVMELDETLPWSERFVGDAKKPFFAAMTDLRVLNEDTNLNHSRCTQFSLEDVDTDTFTRSCSMCTLPIHCSQQPTPHLKQTASCYFR